MYAMRPTKKRKDSKLEKAWYSRMFSSITNTFNNAVTTILTTSIRIPTRLLTSSSRGNLKKSTEDHVLYAFKYANCRSGCCDSEQYKVGKTINMNNRAKSYFTLHPEGKIYHTVKCKNIDSAEKMLHAVLQSKGYRAHDKREIFNVPGNILILYMDIVSKMSNALDESNDVKSLQKLNNSISCH